jgi:hypothetical protein
MSRAISGKLARKRALERRLTAYGLAAGAALAGTASAEADIYYSPADITMSNGYTSHLIDLDGNGVDDIELVFVSTTSTTDPPFTTRGRIGGVSGQNNAEILASTPTTFFPPALRRQSGEAISADAGHWTTFAATLFAEVRYFIGGNLEFSSVSGNFTEPGYFGVRFEAGSSTEVYGWVQVDQIASDFSSYHVSGWAFESSGGPIAAGEVPEPSSLLAWLAMGAAGVLVWRGSRQEPRSEHDA